MGKTYVARERAGDALTWIRLCSWLAISAVAERLLGPGAAGANGFRIAIRPPAAG